MEPSASRRFSTQSFSSPARPLRTRYARLPSHDPRNRPPCTWLPRSLRTLSRTRGDFPPRREASRKESACVGSGTWDGSHRRFHSTSTTQCIALGLRRKCRGAIRRCSFAPQQRLRPCVARSASSHSRCKVPGIAARQPCLPPLLHRGICGGGNNIKELVNHLHIRQKERVKHSKRPRSATSQDVPQTRWNELRQVVYYHGLHYRKTEEH